MDRRRSYRASRSRSLRRRSPERRRRRSRSYSRSPSRGRGRSRSRSVVSRQRQSSRADNGRRDHDRGDTRRYDRRSISTSRERRQEWSRREREANIYVRSSRRSRSCSPRGFERSESNRSRWDSRHRRTRSPSPRRRSPTPRQQSVRTRQRSPASSHRSPSWHRRCTSQHQRSPPSSRQHSPNGRWQIGTSRRRSATQRKRSPSPLTQHSIRQHSPSPRRRSSSSSPRPPSSGSRQHSRLRRDKHYRGRGHGWERSRSQSASRWSRTDTAGYLSNDSSPGHSSTRSDDKPPTRRTSSDAERVSMIKVSPKLELVAATNSHDESKPESIKAAKVNADVHQSDYKGSCRPHDGPQFPDYSHSHTNTRNHYQDGQGKPSSPATHETATPVKAPDRFSTLSPHTTNNHGTSSTPPTSSGAYHVPAHGNLIQDKKREARYEAHRAYLKSNSDYNRAEMKCMSLGAELRLAEFWLAIMTKNLEDVGKRIEVHDWNFQKAAELDESAA